MKRFMDGEDRRQIVLLPHCLDDYVTENNPVRVIEATDRLGNRRPGLDYRAACQRLSRDHHPDIASERRATGSATASNVSRRLRRLRLCPMSEDR